MDSTDAEFYCGVREREIKNKRDAINSGLERGVSIHEDEGEGWYAHLEAMEAVW